jgi:hypothetical protein
MWRLAVPTLTGPKVDDWLVHVVGLLVILIGPTMLTVVWQKTEHSALVSTMVIGAAWAFTARILVCPGGASARHIALTPVEVLLLVGMGVTLRRYTRRCGWIVITALLGDLHLWMRAYAAPFLQPKSGRGYPGASVNPVGDATWR